MLTVTITGKDAISDLLARLGDAVKPKDSESDLLVAVQPMVSAAKGNVVLGPPSLHLRDNIGAAPVPDKPGWVAVGAFAVAKIGEFFYGPFLEFGTVKQVAQPWLRPAYDATIDAVKARVTSLLRGRVLAAVKR